MKKHKILGACGAALVMLAGSVVPGMAELPPAAVVAQMKGGKITAVGKDDIQVDGQTFRINPKAEIVNHEGELMTMEEIRPNGLVKYVLKAGQIEAMIVTNPQ